MGRRIRGEEEAWDSMERIAYKVTVDYRTLYFDQFPKMAEMSGTVTLIVLKGGPYLICNYLPQCSFILLVFIEDLPAVFWSL